MNTEFGIAMAGLCLFVSPPSGLALLPNQNPVVYTTGNGCADPPGLNFLRKKQINPLSVFRLRSGRLVRANV